MKYEDLRECAVNSCRIAGRFHEWVTDGTRVWGLIESPNGHICLERSCDIRFIDHKPKPDLDIAQGGETIRDMPDELPKTINMSNLEATGRISLGEPNDE